MPLIEYIQELKTDQGENISEMSHKGIVMLVFLRHFGCVFCREALMEIKKERSNWESKGIQVVLLYPSDKESGKEYLTQFDLLDIPSISDPSCSVYEKFGLGKGNFGQLFGLKTFFRGFEAAAKSPFPILKQVGDGFQMPGIFVLFKGQVRDSYIHRTASDRPDYNELLACCAS